MQTLGFLGPRGTHSEAAAMFLSDKIGGAELRPYPDIFSVMQAAADGEVDSCVVPVENSLEGAVNVTMDTLAQADDLAIERELIWDIHNQLMAKDAAAERGDRLEGRAGRGGHMHGTGRGAVRSFRRRYGDPGQHDEFHAVLPAAPPPRPRGG